MEKVNILGVKFDNVDMNEAIKKCQEFINSDGLNMIVTANPEIIMLARKDKEFMDNINQASLVVADGIGVIKAAQLLKTPLKERVAGFDLICNILQSEIIAEKKVYILGAKPGVAEQAKVNIENKYNVKVVGTHDGYFTQEQTPQIVQEISQSGANILLVGIGMKKQEQFILQNKDNLNVKLAIGCGGSIDVFAGTVQRAPAFWVNHNLEWLYRVIKQPSRIPRIMALPKFLLVAIFNKRKGDEVV